MNKRYLCTCLYVLALTSTAMAQTAAELRDRGEVIWKESCADCHGELGEGVEGAFERPLIGDDSVGQLTKLIDRTMPEGSPEDCVGVAAQAVSEYLHHRFYSEAARVRNRPPREMLSRLTAKQLQQSLADLYANFTRKQLTAADVTHGLRGRYYGDARYRDEKLKRIEPALDFDFGRESPVEGLDAKEFSIRWDGGLLVNETGRYEIVVHSTCAFMFYLGADDREFINNYVQSGDKTDFRRTIKLTAGRIYPLEIEFRQNKRKTELPPAEFTLSWVPPNETERVIPTSHLVAESPADGFSLQASLPPDDQSYGFERGIAVDKDWDSSVTAAAIEFAKIANDELWPVYQRQNRKKASGRKLLANFLIELIQVAFRRSLSAEEENRYVHHQIKVEPDDAEAIKRVCLLSLKSPWFLYPTLDIGLEESQEIANRMALTMFDSLPIGEAKLGRSKFSDERAVRRFVEANTDDYRFRAKTLDFIHGWLNLNHFGSITKSEDSFADFSPELVSDLRLSLNHFVEHVLWSEKSDYRELFLADYGFTTKEIAAFYGEPWEAKAEPGSDVAETVSSEFHSGVLTHPLLMSGLAYRDSTSPIHRGVFLIRYMLGRTLRPPAEAFTPFSPDLHPGLTTRERVELQTSSDGCQVCHSKINGLGFVLENFDAVGKYRTLENQKTINAVGQYTDRNDNLVEFDGVGDLANYLATSEDAHRAFVSRAFQHFVKQPPAAYGPETLDQLVSSFRKNDYNVRQLLTEIIVIAALGAPDESVAVNAS